MPAPRQPTPEVLAILDTNIVGGPESRVLLAAPTKQAFSDVPPDVHVRWSLPRIVVDERHAQLVRAWEGKLGAYNAVRDLMSDDAPITDRVLREVLGARIQQDVDDLKLEVLDCDFSQVNVAELVQRAVWCESPFSRSEKGEKGFKDSIVEETVVQVVNQAKLNNHTRIVFVSGDELLRTSIEDRLRRPRYFNAFKQLSDLRNLLGFLTSDVPQNLRQQLQKEALTQLTAMRSQIDTKINSDFKAILDDLPPETSEVVSPPWEVADTPALVEKSGHSLHWRATVRSKREAWGMDTLPDPPSPSQYGPLFVGSELSSSPGGLWPILPSLDRSGLLVTSPRDRGIFSGGRIDSSLLFPSEVTRKPLTVRRFRGLGWFDFTVEWSAQLTKDHLSKPSLMFVKHKSGTWSSP